MEKTSMCDCGKWFERNVITGESGEPDRVEYICRNHAYGGLKYLLVPMDEETIKAIGTTHTHALQPLGRVDVEAWENDREAREQREKEFEEQGGYFGKPKTEPAVTKTRLEPGETLTDSIETLNFVLGMQVVTSNNPHLIGDLIHMNKDDRPMFLAYNAFFYGLIMGKRAERARKHRAS